MVQLAAEIGQGLAVARFRPEGAADALALDRRAAGMEDKKGDELLLPRARGAGRRTAVGEQPESSEQLDAQPGRGSHGSRLHANSNSERKNRPMVATPADTAHPAREPLQPRNTRLRAASVGMVASPRQTGPATDRDEHLDTPAATLDDLRVVSDMMQPQRQPSRQTFACVAVGLSLTFALSRSLAAQWTNVPQAAGPRTADGRLNLSAPTPRLPDGKPDLSGTWEPSDNRYVGNIAAGIGSDAVPFQPWARAAFESRRNGSHAREDPPASCLPQGVPRLGAAPAPWKVVLTPQSIVILYEAFNLWRQVFLDGRELMRDPNPTWLGYSTGKWDGDTLVVDTRGFNGRAWLDQMGRPSTNELHVIERFTRTDSGHMRVQVTIDDPKAYTRPWTVTEEARLLPNAEPMEFICNENNRDIEHLPGEGLR
jgi:hypothetical protein